MIPPEVRQALVLGGACVFAALGAWFLFIARRDEGRGLRLSLPGVGRLSAATLLVFGLSSLGMAYHIVVYELNFRQFRAPMWLALAVCLVAVGLSLATDRLDNRRDERDSGRPGG